MGPEAKLEHAVVNYAKKKGVLTYKWASPSHRGVPDRIFIFPTGIVLFIEFKAPTGRLSPLQKITIDKMVEQGALVAVVNSLLTACDIIDKLLTMQNTITPR